MISQKDIQSFKEWHRILLRVNEFICLLPHPGLREYIANYNITFPTHDLMPDSFTVMPCGCSTLAIEKDSNNMSIDLHGPITKPYIAGSHANQLEMIVTVEFKPAGLYALTGINQSELIDQTLPFQTVNPALSKLISEMMEKSKSIYEIVAGFDILFGSKLHTVFHPELKLMLHNIKDCAGNISIKSLSNNIHYSERHLNRIFNQHVGLSAKSFSRLIRINNTFRLLKKPHHSLAFISDVAGFHDLSHFIHDFKLTCGVTPGEYRANMSDFYSNPTKF